MYYYSGEPLKALEDHQVIIIFNIYYKGLGAIREKCYQSRNVGYHTLTDS
jgi:hypothetical protein